MTYHEIEHAHERYRYRRAEQVGDHEYVVEVYHPARDEWREVRNGSSRDWFAIGFRAGMEAARQGGVQEDMFS